MSARSEARAAEDIYRDAPAKFRIGDRVECSSGKGVVEFIAFSTAMDAPLYTVRIDSRITVRLLECELRRST